MNFNDISQKIKDFTNKLAVNGVPLLFVRDPKTSIGSVSLTLVIVSFTMVVVGLVGKWSKTLDGIDLNQALNLFYACSALYWGRKLSSTNSSGSSNIDPPAGP